MTIPTDKAKLASELRGTVGHARATARNPAAQVNELRGALKGLLNYCEALSPQGAVVGDREPIVFESVERFIAYLDHMETQFNADWERTEDAPTARMYGAGASLVLRTLSEIVRRSNLSIAPPTKPNDAGLSDKTDEEILAEEANRPQYKLLGAAVSWREIALVAMSRARSAGAGFVVTEERVPLKTYESAVKGRADFRDALVKEREKSVTLLKVIANFANPDYWIDEPGNLQWTGKRHAIEYAQSAMDDTITAAANVGEGRG